MPPSASRLRSHAPGRRPIPRPSSGGRSTLSLHRQGPQPLDFGSAPFDPVQDVSPQTASCPVRKPSHSLRKATSSEPRASSRPTHDSRRPRSPDRSPSSCCSSPQGLDLRLTDGRSRPPHPPHRAARPAPLLLARLLEPSERRTPQAPPTPLLGGVLLLGSSPAPPGAMPGRIAPPRRDRPRAWRASRTPRGRFEPLAQRRPADSAASSRCTASRRGDRPVPGGAADSSRAASAPPVPATVPPPRRALPAHRSAVVPSGPRGQFVPGFDEFSLDRQPRGDLVGGCP